MERTEIAALYQDAAAYGGKTITVCGWARTIRDSKNLGFIDLNDGSSFKGVQIVFEADKINNFIRTQTLITDQFTRKLDEYYEQHRE